MRYHIHTYGCQMNVRDSEAVAALLEAAGHERAACEADAQLVLVNSCTVRDMAERKAVGKCGNLIAAKEGRGRRAEGSSVRIVGLMGCAVKRLGQDVFKALPHLDFAVGPRRFGAIPHLVERCLAGETRILELPDDDEVPAGLDAHPDASRGGASFQSHVTVLLGCDNRCSYCIVPDVRGHEYSRPAREIVAEVRALALRGVKEVCLLGQSVLRYGMRTKAWTDADAPSPGGFTEPFPRLLEALSAIDGLMRIRFTSAHPKGCTDELLRAYRELPKVCRHLHLPVQSGSDRLLAEMGRRYTRAEYLDAVRRLRGFDPEFSVTTDVIVGYPGETEEDFEATRSLMDEAGFDNAFIFKYSPRPGTRSAELPDDVPAAEKERRDQVLLADQEVRGQSRNERLVGTVREVLAEGPSIRNAARWSGRDSGNRIVVFAPPPGISPGDAVRVRITDAHPQVLVGEVDCMEALKE
ncbi:MAG: tRNA (N6-isopentenyl adenosine(37)-C2)-methylthiotransferase MiaB [Kiritimatiellae bacterium]|nr:tRNA (N6-isopentenyl adenosine(37)-C2)-methylthiotransferase MiaB [Kiritimatiellia bacterium]